MDIYILDEGFNIIDLVDDYEYLLWDTAFYKRGFFEMKVPISRLDSMSRGRYIYRYESDYTGRINTISIDGQLVSTSGSFLESLLDFRVDILGKEFTGKAETAMFNLVRDNAIESRPIAGLTLGTDRKRGQSGTFSALGKGIASYFYEIAEVYDLSFNIKYIPETKKLEFSVIEGLNRTQSQNENDWCVFSRDMGNVDAEYYETNTDYANYAYVYGEQPKRLCVTIDESAGGEKRELFVDGGDLKQSDGMSTSEYTELLKQRGYEKLSEVGRFETIDFVVDHNTDMPFGLGDICTYKHMDMDKIYEFRVTEIKETHENGGFKKNIVLGRYNFGVVEAMKKGVI